MDDAAGDSVGETAEPFFMVIGRVVRPHGVRGEMRVAIHTELPERFTWLESVYLARDPEEREPRRVGVESVRFHKGYALVQFAGHDSRDEAEELRGLWLMVPDTEAIPLEEGEVYLYQLQGLDVHSDEGEYLGEIVDILETNANEVFVVQGPRGEILVPNIPDVVLEVDLEQGQMTIHILEGLL